MKSQSTPAPKGSDLGGDPVKKNMFCVCVCVLRSFSLDYYR